MDTKNDDSAGSDSLDTSLQTKLVVDDTGQNQSPDIKNLSMQFEQCVGDNCCKEIKIEGDNGNGSQANTDGSAVVQNPQDISNGALSNNIEHESNSGNSNVASGSTARKSCEDISNNCTFETKVKQISQDLKETSLAEFTDNTAPLTTSESQISVVSQCSSSLETNETALNNESTDELEASRLKKVRFHPDVKENDGGNRVIPKKKKKLKGAGLSKNSESEIAFPGNRAAGTDDEIECEEGEHDSPEEAFSLSKTIAEAKQYLEAHPLTYVRLNNSKKQLPQAEPEGSTQISDSSDEENCVEQGENGVDRILGKHVRNGKVEYLLRYKATVGLHWENEDLIQKMCPNLLMKYKTDAQRNQERLMRHVGKRQNVRQRYTHF